MKSREMPIIEKNREATPQELGEKFLDNEETGLTHKIKNVLNILRPQGFIEIMSRIGGAGGVFSGLEISRIAFLNPAQMSSSADVNIMRAIAVCFTVAGGMVFSFSIKDTLDRIRIEKEIEAEKK